MDKLNGPLADAVAVSVAYVIRSTVEFPPDTPVAPPPNQPYVVLPAAPRPYRAAFNDPRVDAVAVSVAYVIRFTELYIGKPGEPPLPPPNHPSVRVPTDVALVLTEALDWLHRSCGLNPQQ